MADSAQARFRGLRIYTDPDGLFWIRYPSDWHEHHLSPDHEGAMFSPHATSPRAWLAIWKTALNVSVTAADIADLRSGLDEGLALMPGSQILSGGEKAQENLIKFERTYTFLQDGETLKRQSWVIYADKWQIALMWEGHLEDYDRWYAMANYSFLTLKLADVLYFSTDRGLTAHQKEENTIE